MGHSSRGEPDAESVASVSVVYAGRRGRRGATGSISCVCARGSGGIRGAANAAPLLAQVWNAESVALFAATKLAFDPTGILNPGVKVPLAGQEPFPAIKYDPDAAPIAPEARVALDAVSRSQRWAQHRLGLL
ncbi:hypothetical protein EBR44_09620 [bacterium]|nr:hypothetical protein [bacterium]